MNNSNRWQNNRSSNNRNYSSSSRSSMGMGGRESSPRRDWYERDPMDERSGYRDEQDRHMNSDYGYSQQRRAGRGSRNEHEFDTFGSRSSSSSDFYRPSDSEEEHSYGQSEYRQRPYEQSSYGQNNYGRANLDGGNSFSRSERGDYDSQRWTQSAGAYGSPSRRRSYSQQDEYSPANRDETYGSGGYYGPDRATDGGSSYGQDFGRSRSSDHGQSYGYRGESSRYGQSYGGQEDSSRESRGQYAGRGPKGFRRSDERIKEEVCEMLTRHHGIDADDIDVEVKDGEVTLSGSVSERRMKHLAEDVAEQCFGVKDITNNIRVKRAEESQSLSSTTESSSNQDRKSAGSSGSSTASGKKSSGSTSTSSNSLPN